MNILTKFQKNPTSGLGREMFTDRQLDGQTDAGEFPRRKKSSSGLQELIMPEPTGGLGGPLVPRPTVKLSTLGRDAMTRNVY